MAFGYFRKQFFICFCALALSASVCRAEKLVSGGIVLDADSKRPLEGATVAAFNDKGEVVGSDITDPDGQWSIETSWDDANIPPPPKKEGLFSTMLGVITWPVRTVAGAVNDTGKAVFKSAAKAAGGAAAAGAAIAAVGGGPIASAAVGTAGRKVGELATGAVIGESDDVKKEVDTSGCISVRVWKSGYKEYNGTVGVYSLERVEDEDKRKYSLAFFDPVQLADNESPNVSGAPRELFVFKRVTAEPAIANAGTLVRFRAEIVITRDVLPYVRMVARNITARQEFELTHTGGAIWEGKYILPKKGPYRNHQITIVAYRIRPDKKQERDRGLEERIEDRGVWNPEKSFPIDPALLACRNRGLAVVTVTKPPKIDR